MKLVGANSQAQVAGVEELPDKVNYFLSNDPTKWRTNVSTYAKVRYDDVYPGVDLVYYGNQQRLEYDFVVAPGVDPNAIRFTFAGADQVEVDAQGNLVLHTAGGPVRQHKPVVYQEVDGIRQEIAGGYVLTDTQHVGFQVAAYDHSQPLVMDPVLVYATYLGGSGSEGVGDGAAIAVDALGNAYVIGNTASTNFPTLNPVQETFGGGGGVGDVFVATLNPSGTALVYATYLGGSDQDRGRGIALDADGNAYVTGQTLSTNFPTANALQPVFGGGGGSGDAFVAKLDPTGSMLVYSTYLGGSGSDAGISVRVGGDGSAYVAGLAVSANFPVTMGAFQTVFAGSSTANFGDLFVAKLNPVGSALVYCTYLGGSKDEAVPRMPVDADGNAYITGVTVSPNFPVTPGAFQTTYSGDPADAFVTKLNAAGSALVYSTFLGGSARDVGHAIVVDSAGFAYVTGQTHSANFPTTSDAVQTVFGGGTCGSEPCSDGFVAKLDPTGTALIYSTLLGGNNADLSLGIAVDAAGNAYVSGQTQSSNFPLGNAMQSSLSGTQDAFVAKLNGAGTALMFSSYLGGSGADLAMPIALDKDGNAYVAGNTSSTDFPTKNPLQSASGGGQDAFIAKIAP